MSVLNSYIGRTILSLISNESLQIIANINMIESISDDESDDEQDEVVCVFIEKIICS